MELHPESACYLQHSRETGVPVLAKCLVEAFPAEACVPRDLAHSLGPRNVAKSTRDPSRILRSLFQPGIQVRGHLLRRPQLLCDVVCHRLRPPRRCGFLHLWCLRHNSPCNPFASVSAVSMSLCWDDLSPPARRMIRTPLRSV